MALRYGFSFLSLIRTDNNNTIMQFPTHCVHNLAIDPLDENYFISAGPSGNPNVCLWDRRSGSRSASTIPLSDGSGGPVLEFKPGIDNSQNASIYSLRFCGYKRGSFGILSSSGEIKIIETAEHTLSTPASSPTPNHLDTTDHSGEWSVHKHYTRITHHLQHPWYRSQSSVQPAVSRVIAYDFMGPADSHNAGHVIALRGSHEMDILRIPGVTPLAALTSLDELQVLHDGNVETHTPTPPNRTIASQLIDLQRLARRGKGTLSVRNPVKSGPESQLPRHFRLDEHSFGFPHAQLKLQDHLNILSIQRRRCREGYLFDPQRNKEIVSNDPLLVDLWDTVQTFEDIAARDALLSEDLDLTYLGIFDIWRNSLGAAPAGMRIINKEGANVSRFVNAVKGIVQRWSAFSGPETRYPAHRQLCLAICGWDFDRRKQRQSSPTISDFSTRAHAYRAIVQAYFRGERSFALDLLKSAVEQKLIDNIGLGAVIASGEAVTDEQRDLCAWMAAQTDDPYLRSLLLYFNTGRWSTIVETTELALRDRVAVALRYLDDRSLGNFLTATTAAVIDEGDLEGIILTGLSNSAVPLLQNYIAKTGDLQTAVLALSPASARFAGDTIYDYWKETYFMYLQSWRCFIERTRFITHMNRRTTPRPSRELPSMLPVTIRCLHCQAPLTQNPTETDSRRRRDGSFGSTGASASQGMVGVTCSICARPMPRCGICMLWLGTPDPARLPAVVRTSGSTESVTHKRDDRRDPLETQIMWCMKCLHGFHGHHAKEWFARHRICAVPDCECVCGVLH